MRTLYCLLAVLIHALLLAPAVTSKKVYIVYLGGYSHGKDATTNDFTRATNSHHKFLSSFLKSNEKAKEAMIYSYNKHINGFAAYLDENEAMEISKHSDVLSVFENGFKQLHTTRTWSFLGVEKDDDQVPPSSIWTKASYGQDIIIANLDTGVWPESESFNDDGMWPVPSRWRGSCQNNTKAGVMCNRKLIGAKYFDKFFQFQSGGSSESYIGSARDIDGHGTHTLSTLGGSFVPNASVYGYAKGTAKGGSPGARVASYKVCWGGQCADADILAGFDEAINDGVDVISVSLGGYSLNYFTDAVAVGAFHAVLNGIDVACSAGNAGPYDSTVSNTAPWVTTVAASTLDREFVNYVTLGNNETFMGLTMASGSLPENKMYPLINSVDAKADNASIYEAKFCGNNSLSSEKANGKIVICPRGEYERIEKGAAVQQAGGVGMIHVNDEEEEMAADMQLLPSTMISYKDGLILQSYMNSTTSPVGTITEGKSVIGVKPSPMMAEFSSRGPNDMCPQILKPDITAPGVRIMAAYSEAAPPAYSPFDRRITPFYMISGTSMSCPHVAGIMGLLRKLYPHWSPAAIRSAIMTTAETLDNTGKPMTDENGGDATPFVYGSGHIQPNLAMNPGLVYDMEIKDYLDFICSFGFNSTQMGRFLGNPYKCPWEKMVVENLNNPSFAIPRLEGTMTVSRTVKNVGTPGTYEAKIEAPAGILVSVHPSVLQFKEAGEEKEFKVTFNSTEESVGKGYVFGMFSWTDGKHWVRSPMAVNATS